jgi:CBS domain-containing protein
MYVKRLLPAAREKLVIIADDAPLMEAANLLHKGTDLVIVCDSAGLVAGVVTKTDVVGQMSRCQGASCTMAASLTMTRDVVTCRPDELLQEVWKRMKERKHSCGGLGFQSSESTSCTRHSPSSSR